MAKIYLQRVYDFHAPAPQHCYLVDRLWPRGISKERLQGVEWLKQVTPDNALRQWYHQHLDLWDEFQQRYREQLEKTDAWQPLVALLREGESLTLLYGSKNTQRNHAMVLRDFLLVQLHC
jgi:uncharacterized protein YeaO (DUF488 family)